MKSEEKSKELLMRLVHHPKLLARMEGLLNVVENTAGNCRKANDAEEYVIEELRKMGNEALQSWGEASAQKALEAVEKESGDVFKNGKKNCIGTVHLEQ